MNRLVSDDNLFHPYHYVYIFSKSSTTIAALQPAQLPAVDPLHPSHLAEIKVGLPGQPRESIFDDRLSYFKAIRFKKKITWAAITHSGTWSATCSARSARTRTKLWWCVGFSFSFSHKGYQSQNKGQENDWFPHDEKSDWIAKKMSKPVCECYQNLFFNILRASLEIERFSKSTLVRLPIH